MNTYLAQGLTGFSGFSSTEGVTDPASRVADLISQVVAVITIFAGFVFVFWFVIGALTWITGGHNPDQVEKAKNQMSNAILGMIFTVISLPIIYIIGKLIGLDIIDFPSVIPFLIPN